MIMSYLLSASAFLSGVGLNVTSGWLITMASFMPPVLTLNVAVVMVRFFGISRSVARYSERIISHKMVFAKLADLRSDLYRRITANPFELLKSNRTGQLVKQVVDDVERSQEYELRVILPGATTLVTLLACTGLAFWLQPKIAIIWGIAFVLLALLIPSLVNRSIGNSAKRVETLESEYADRIRSNSHGYLEADNYGYSNQLLDHTHLLENQIKIAEIQYLSRVRNFQILINLIISMVLILTVLNVSLPAVQVAMLIFLSLTGFEAALAWYPNLFSSGKLLNAKNKLKLIPEVSSQRKTKVAYGTIKANNFQPYWNQPNFTPINFELNRGDVLVLRGRSGSGKTTTALGILGFLDYKGSLTINNLEVREIENLTDLVAGSLQSGHIFNTSLLENLKISNPSLNNILEVMDLLELNQLVSEMTNGLETIVGQFGRGLSGGEIKRINLARALINDAPILILDEPLEHLDPDLALRIEQRILDRYRDRVLIIITHSGFSGLPERNLEQLVEN